MRINRTIYPGLICILFIILAGCISKKEKLSDSSPGGETVITVKGKKVTPFDPWKVTLRVQAYDRFDKKLTFEFYNSDLDENTVHFSWEGESTCLIEFMQQDESQKNFRLNVSPKRIHLKELH